jgi:parallel beta-helix repeat protein
MPAKATSLSQRRFVMMYGNRTFLLALVALAMATAPTSIWAETCHVNSSSGNNLSGAGTASDPFKTITYALTQCGRIGDIIRVEAADPYDVANGERFPIPIARGVTLQGIGTPIIDGVIKPVIRGGGHYDIPDSPIGRYVAILGADEAMITGFRFDVINEPDTQHTGTGILCDSTSPTIEDNAFGGEAHAGIATLGTAHPFIRDNLFNRNMAGNLNWGVTVYGDSYPVIQSNNFMTKSGVDSTDRSYPAIEGNTFSTFGTGISTKGWSNATITNNIINGNDEMGIFIRMESTPMIQDNLITNNPTGVYISPGTPCPHPDLGGGGRSDGGNTLSNDEWDLLNRCGNPIIARNNRWSHSPCCDYIDSEDVYDDEEDLFAGAVDFGLCIYCQAQQPWPPVSLRLPEPVPPFHYNSLYLVGCGPCPQCFEKPCDPRVNQDYDKFIIWEPQDEIAYSFSMAQLGLDAKSVVMIAAAPVGELKGHQLFVGSVSGVDGRQPDTGFLVFFDESGHVIKRIEGKTPFEQLGTNIDVYGDEIVVTSKSRLLRLKGTEIVYEMDFPEYYVASHDVTVAFTEDVDGDGKPEILLGTPYETAGKMLEAGRIRVLGSKGNNVISTVSGRSAGEHLGDILQPIVLHREGKIVP